MKVYTYAVGMFLIELKLSWVFVQTYFPILSVIFSIITANFPTEWVGLLSGRVTALQSWTLYLYCHLNSNSMYFKDIQPKRIPSAFLKLIQMTSRFTTHAVWLFATCLGHFD